VWKEDAESLVLLPQGEEDIYTCTFVLPCHLGPDQLNPSARCGCYSGVVVGERECEFGSDFSSPNPGEGTEICPELIPVRAKGDAAVNAGH
jgi:hypothetical protein